MLIALRDALENCSLPDQVDNRSVDLDTTQVLRVADALVQIFQALDLSHAADDLVSKRNMISSAQEKKASKEGIQLTCPNCSGLGLEQVIGDSEKLRKSLRIIMRAVHMCENILDGIVSQKSLQQAARDAYKITYEGKHNCWEESVFLSAINNISISTEDFMLEIGGDDDSIRRVIHLSHKLHVCLKTLNTNLKTAS